MVRTSLTRGWHSMKEQSYILILLFIYRLLWGYFLYRFVRSAVIPVMQHYPDADAGGSALGRLLFYIEGQFALSSDSAVHGWLLMLLALSLLRLLASPFIRAGLIYELHQESKGERGLFFFPGMKLHGLSVLLLSLVEWLLALLPLWWLAPKVYGLLLSSVMDYSKLLTVVPYILAWLVYLYLVRLFILYMQFGYTAGNGMFSSLLIAFQVLFTAILISLVLGAGGLVLLLISGLTGILAPGLAALLIRQLCPLPATLFRMWGVAAQYHLWHSKRFPQ